MTSKVVKKKSKMEPKVSQRKEKRKNWFNKKQKLAAKKIPKKIPKKITLEDLSESDFDSNDDDDILEDDEEYGTLTDTDDESDDDAELELPEPSDDSDDEKKPKVPRATIKDCRTVFVGNLPNDIDKKKIMKFFSKYGEVENVRLRCPPVADPSIPKKVATISKDFHNERSNIIAFVCFKSEEFATKALEANNAKFGDHTLRVDSAVKKPKDSKKAVFIGNLPFSAEEDQVRNIFANCGEIESVRIVRDKNTCVGKGFGFINFCERHSVPLALDHNGELIGKRPIRVKKIEKSHKNKEKLTNPKTNWENRKKKFPVKDKKERKEKFQGELAIKKQKKKKMKKTHLQKKKEIFKKILNQPSKKE